jgi:hypothetical protein
MKIKRTVKDEYLGIALKYAGETEIINEDRMDPNYSPHPIRQRGFWRIGINRRQG